MQPSFLQKEFPLPKQWKNVLLRQPFWQKAWGIFRRGQLLREYAARREYYAGLASEQGLVYKEIDLINAIQTKLKKRHYYPEQRSLGDIHTFAFIPLRSGHHHLLSDLRELGPLTVFDYESFGFRVEEFRRADEVGLARRQAMNEMVMPALRAAHAERPVDWVFVYASGLEISASTVQSIIEKVGLPTVNLCMDDKQSWTGRWMGDHFAGQVGIASIFDLSWTTARVACEWYLVEGGRPIYMPEGFDMSSYRPMPVAKDIPISFMGRAYGYRPLVIRYLRQHGVPIQTFGSGWPDSRWVDDPVEIINRSLINLGMGGIGYSESLTNVKGRDFDIPGVGGGVYLTSFNPDLAQHFVTGKEIVCYRNRDEMLELIRYYLAHPEEAMAIAQRGYKRSLQEHRWLHRYQKICRILGILT
ncbi:MAG: CgeB family protein [Ardenticatenaceae bacterium]